MQHEVMASLISCAPDDTTKQKTEKIKQQKKYNASNHLLVFK